MSRPKYEVADVIKRFGKQFSAQYHPNGFQQKALHALTLCRTAEPGWHKEECDCCKQIRISYNSCGNRHCPKCQAAYQAFWVEGLLERVLPVKHYHIVFTLPHELNCISLLDNKWFYNRLFSAAWDTLRSFGYTHFGVESGAIMVLHTWGQNLKMVMKPRTETTRERLLRLTGFDMCRCPFCGKGTMRVIEITTSTKNLDKCISI